MLIKSSVMSKSWDVNVLNRCDTYFGDLILYSNSLNCKMKKKEGEEKVFVKRKTSAMP